MGLYERARDSMDAIELDQLASYMSISAVREKVAGNEYAVNETLHRLAHDGISSVRWVVAENKNAPVS